MYRSIVSILRIAAGLTLLLFGIIGLLLPILQGWLLILIAIPIISPAHGKKMVAKAKEWKAKGFEWWKRRNSKSEVQNTK